MHVINPIFTYELLHVFAYITFIHEHISTIQHNNSIFVYAYLPPQYCAFALFFPFYFIIELHPLYDTGRLL